MVINWKLLTHPANWLIVFLMLMIAAVGGHLVLTYFGAEPANNGSKQPVGPNRNDISGAVLGAA